MQSTTVGIDDITALGALADELGLVLFDAPVSGTRAPAEAGQLLILAAGPEEHRPSVTPVLDAVGARTVWTGEDAAAGTSTRLKLVVNSWVIAASVAAGTAAKDARLIVEAGARHGIRLDLAAASAARLDRAAARGHAAEDLAAAYYAGFDE